MYLSLALEWCFVTALCTVSSRELRGNGSDALMLPLLDLVDYASIPAPVPRIPPTMNTDDHGKSVNYI